MNLSGQLRMTVYVSLLAALIVGCSAWISISLNHSPFRN
jgi:hypothetical protein